MDHDTLGYLRERLFFAFFHHLNILELFFWGSDGHDSRKYVCVCIHGMTLSLFRLCVRACLCV